MTTRFEATKAALEEKRQVANLEHLAKVDLKVEGIIAELDKKRAELVALRAEIARIADNPAASDEEVNDALRKSPYGDFVLFAPFLRTYHR